MIYVLIETGQASPIGVFGTLDSADQGVQEYYGKPELLEQIKVSDSGIEWHRSIRDSDGDRIEITLFSYWIDDI